MLFRSELNRLTSGPGVDNELERMKRELAAGSAKQLEAGASGVAKPGDVQDAEVEEEGGAK